jgi:quinol monooxygenase YgiN
MSVWLALESKVKKGEFDKLLPFLEKNLPNTRSAPGALSVSILYDEETDAFLIFEEWLSRQHHQNYVKAISENGVMQQLVAFLDGPPTVKYYSKLTI